MPDVKVSPSGIVIGLAGVLILGAFGWLTFGYKPTPAPPPVLTEEAKQYRVHLGLTNVHMQAAESYVQSRLVEILGDITNKGTRPVKAIAVTCLFTNYAGQEIARERVYVFGPATGTLGPSQTKSFRMAFDTIPESWNQAMPTLIIAEIQFA